MRDKKHNDDNNVDSDCCNDNNSNHDNTNHHNTAENKANVEITSTYKNKSQIGKTLSTNANEFSAVMEEHKVQKQIDEQKKTKEEEREEHADEKEFSACHISSRSAEETMEINKWKTNSQKTKPIIMRETRNINRANNISVGSHEKNNNTHERECSGASSFVESESEWTSSNLSKENNNNEKLFNTATNLHGESKVFDSSSVEDVTQADKGTAEVNKHMETSRNNVNSSEITSHQENEEEQRIINVSDSISSSNIESPQRTISLWSSDELVNDTETTVEFHKMDEIETEMMEEAQTPYDALIVHNEENEWKHKLMFEYKFKKTPKHLTWKELGQEIECVDCIIEPDAHRPEEMFTITFYFINKQTGTRDVMWSTRNDVAYSEGLTDLLAAVGTCLGRAEVHRTIRFDDGVGATRDVSIRKASRFTSDIVLAFRPAETYDKYTRKEEMNEYEASMEAAGMSMWGFHPELMNPEYNDLDFKDPPGTYTITISAHSFAFILLRAMKRLLQRPMRDFYRPSQVARVATITNREEIGISYAVKGWLGIDKPFYPHLNSIEAVQDHWLGRDAPFTLCAIINKLREMTYLQKENPEFQSWLSLRYQSTRVALRNIHVKLLGVGASTLFLPTQHSTTVNKLLPRTQQRKLFASFSVNAMLGLPDETRRLGEFRQLTSHPYLADKSSSGNSENESKHTNNNNSSNSNVEGGDVNGSGKVNKATSANVNRR